MNSAQQGVYVNLGVQCPYLVSVSLFSFVSVDTESWSRLSFLGHLTNAPSPKSP
jgi:hypothetical protein